MKRYSGVFTAEDDKGYFVKWSEVISDPGNTLFGLPLSEIQKIIYAFQTSGVDPYEVAQLRRKVSSLESYITALSKY